MNDPRQPFEQIADYYRGEIRTGRLEPGSRLPSAREIARLFEVAIGTVTAAIRELKDDGLVMSWQGKGIFVRDRASLAVDPEATNAEQAYRTITKRLDELQQDFLE